MDAGAAQLSDLQAVARGQMTGCLASQVAEDMFNHAKNSFLCKGKRQFRRPEKTFAAILARKVPERIHKYTAIEANQPVEKSAALAPEVFEASQQKCSLKVDTLSGTSASPAWYSTGPENVSRIHADLALFREMFSTKAYTAIAENAWLGQLLDHSHQIVIRRADSNDESAWLLCLHHWSDSSVLVWPCTRKPFEQNPSEYWFELHMGLQVPVLLAFYDLSLWQAATFEFRSPSWQRLHVGASLQRLPSAVRQVQRLPPQGVAAVGAKCGWWKLGKVFLSNLVKYLGGQVPAAASLFDTAVHLTEHVLECNRGDTLWHLRHRLAMDEASTSFCQELVEVEGVGSVLNREDEDSMKKTQKSAQVCLTEVRAFRCEFSAASLAQAKEQAKDQKKKRKKPAGDSEWRIPLISEVSQKDVARFCPAGGAIWRDRVDGAWCSHFAPFPRVSRSWKKYGEAESLRLCLIDLWQKHCMVQGVPLSDCPLKGLLDSEPLLQPAGAAPISGAASSSSAGRR